MRRERHVDDDDRGHHDHIESHHDHIESLHDHIESLHHHDDARLMSVDELASPVEASGRSGDVSREHPSSPRGSEVTDRIKPLVQVLGSVVAPTTLLTALLFYFGWAHAYWFFHYFGFDLSLLGLTTQDYVMRSVDALFVPLALSLSVVLLTLWVGSMAGSRLSARGNVRTLRRMAVVASGACGLVLFVVGIAGFVLPDARKSYFVYPFSFGAGSVLLLYSSRLYRRHFSDRPEGAKGTIPFIETASTFLVVTISLFWAATNYAAALGDTRARQYEREFRSAPAAVLYSKEPLHLDAPGVEEVSCEESGSGYRYRYQGLRLMIRSGGRYFLLPERWSRTNGVAIVVPETHSVRLQFLRGDGMRRQLDASC